MRAALQDKGWDARAFQGEIKAKLEGGKSGAAYNTILAYLNDQSEPSVDFLRKAAEVLGVRFGWLVAGVGPATDAAEAAHREGEQANEYFDRLLSERSSVAGEVRPHVRAMFADLVVRHYFFRRQQRGWDDRPAPEIPEVADRLADRLFSPLVDEWRIGYLRPERFEEYAVAMLHALRLAIPDREGVSFE